MKALRIITIHKEYILVSDKYKEFKVNLIDLIDKVELGEYFLINAEIVGKDTVSISNIALRKFVDDLVYTGDIKFRYSVKCNYDKIIVTYDDYKNIVIEFKFEKEKIAYLIDGIETSFEKFIEILYSALDKEKLARTNKYKLLGINYIDNLNDRIANLRELSTSKCREIVGKHEIPKKLYEIIKDSKRINYRAIKDYSFFTDYIDKYIDITNDILSNKFIDYIALSSVQCRYKIVNTLEIFWIEFNKDNKMEYIVIIVKDNLIYKAFYTGRYIVNCGINYEYYNKFIEELRTLYYMDFNMKFLNNTVTFNFYDMESIIYTVEKFLNNQLSVLDTKSESSNFYIVHKNKEIPFTLKIKHSNTLLRWSIKKFFGDEYNNNFNILDNVKEDFKESFINKGE